MSSPHFEPLEPRTLLSGVTVITRGYQPFSSDRPDWLDDMAGALVAEIGPGTAVYALRIVESGGRPQIQYFRHLSGDAPMSEVSATGHAVVMLDWADASGVIFSYHSTAEVAALVAPVLLSAFPSIGLDHPLAESPVHLVGHSRGGSLVSALAQDLGERGVWVDQVTTLDPHPVDDDPTARAWANVLFADNYYQTDYFPDGSAVTGALNINLDPHDIDHTQVHTYYHGTIDKQAGSVDGESISSSWYASPPTGPRDSVGYHFSLTGGGDRGSAQAVAGLHASLGGSGARTGINWAGAYYPNLITFDTVSATNTYAIGDAIETSFVYADVNSAANVHFFLDSDLNPYNAGSTWLATQGAPQTGLNLVLEGASLPTEGVAPGNYQLYAQITDTAGFTRYLYAPDAVTLNDATPPAVTQVLLRGSMWDASVLDALAAAGLGEGGFDLQVSSGSAIVPGAAWENIDEVVVRFSEPVVASLADLLIVGVNNALVEATSVVYDAATHSAVFTLDAPLALDKWLIRLADTIQDAAGNAMADHFEQRVNVLPGDLDLDGSVGGDDVSHVRGLLFQAAGMSGYEPMSDVDGSGRILTSDVVRVRNRLAWQLPDGEPAFASIGSNGASQQAGDDSPVAEVPLALPPAAPQPTSASLTMSEPEGAAADRSVFADMLAVFAAYLNTTARAGESIESSDRYGWHRPGLFLHDQRHRFRLRHDQVRDVRQAGDLKSVVVLHDHRVSADRELLDERVGVQVDGE